MVYTLSRNIVLNFSNSISSYKIDLENIIKDASKNDEEYLKIKENLRGNSNGNELMVFSMGSRDLLTYKTDYMYLIPKMLNI